MDKIYHTIHKIEIIYNKIYIQMDMEKEKKSKRLTEKYGFKYPYLKSC